MEFDTAAAPPPSDDGEEVEEVRRPEARLECAAVSHTTASHHALRYPLSVCALLRRYSY